MSNAVFGKNMENVRNRQNINSYSDPKQIQRAINKATFKSRTILNENFVILHNYRTKVIFNKPIAIGMTCLDDAKDFMYKTHYNIIKENFGDKVKLMHMDTGILILSTMNLLVSILITSYKLI